MRISRRPFPTLLPSLAAAAVLALPQVGCSDGPTDPGEEPEPYVLFLSTRDGATDDLGRPMKEIYRVRADGSEVENLTQHPAWLYIHLSLSPDGQKVAFASSRSGCDLWVMETDGTDLTRLTNPEGGTDDGCNGWPRWSPDGSRIAFTTSREDLHVYVMNADGTDPRNISHGLGDAAGHEMAVIGWTPDGMVAFETSTASGGTFESAVYVVNPDGSGLMPLFDVAGDHSPAWSPDGSRIAFIRENDGRQRLHVMNADGTGVRALTDHAGNDRLAGPRNGTETQFHYSPWSPDGTRIAFDRDAEFEWGTWVANVDGSGLLRLTDYPTRFNGWSADGSRIAFTNRVLPQDVFLVNADGTGLFNLTSSPHQDSDALWVPAR